MEIRQGSISDVKEITKVHIDSWKSTYKGILSDEFLQRISFEKREKIWRTFFEDDSITVFVCLNDNKELVGFATLGPARSKKYGYEIELYAIYILKNYQRKGIGKLLIKRIVEFMKENEFKSMIVWVLKDNESYKFYEYLGSKKFIEDDIEIGGKALKKVAYGWSDVKEIIV